MESNRKTRAFGGIVTSFIQYFVLICMQIVVVPIILKMGGKEVLGGYSFIMQIVTWAGAIDLGFGAAIGRGLAQAHGLSDGHGQFRTIFTIGRSYYLMVSVLFSLIMVVLGLNLVTVIHMDPALQQEASYSLYMLAGYSLLKVPLNLFSEALNATQNMVAANIINMIGNVIRLVLSVVFILAGFNLAGMVLAFIIADILTNLMQRAAFFKKFPLDRMRWGFPDRGLLKEMLLFGLTSFLMQIAGRLSASTDSLVIGVTAGAAAIAVYYTSQMPGTVLSQLIYKISDNVQAGLNDLYAQKQFDRIKSVYFRVARYSICMVTGLALGLILFNEYAVKVWVGHGQFAGFDFTILLSVYIVMQVFFYTNSKILMIWGRIRAMSIISVVTGLLKIGFGYFLLKQIGLPGLMLAFIIADLPNLIYAFVTTLRALEIRRVEFWIHSIMPSIKTMVLPTVFLISFVYLKIAMTPVIFIMSVIAFIVIWIVAFGLFAFSKQDRVRVISRLRKGRVVS